MLQLVASLLAAAALALVWAVAAASEPSSSGALRDIGTQAAAGVMFLLAARLSKGDPARIKDGGFPNLRTLAWLVPASVFGQVILGALYRNGATGLIPHVTWAFGAAILAMMLGTFVLTQPAAGPRSMRRASVALISLTGLQVILGVVALILKIQSEQPSQVPEWTHWLRATHAATGAAVFGSSCALGLLIFRNVEPACKQELAQNGKQG